MSDFLAGLNERQMEAVTTTEGYVRVVAGAGSGKTRALTCRYLYLTQMLGVPPYNILCVTFTNKAAKEMKNRIRKMIPDSDLSLITTFHGFCVQFLHEEYQSIQYAKNFLILDEEDSKKILEEIFEELKINTKELSINKALDYIENSKRRCLNPFEDYIDPLISPSLDPIKKKLSDKELSDKENVFLHFLLSERKLMALDFNDLICLTYHILCTREDIRLKWQKRFQYVMVDEFQDVSTPQYGIARILSNYHKNLFVVGDPDQTIYTWRGASVETILDFDKDYPDAKTIIMDINYRSTPEIVNISNSLIDKNEMRIKKNLIANKENGNNAIYFHAKDDTEQGQWCTKQILSLHEKGISYSDIAILYRAHYVSRSIEETLIEHKIPYVIYSGVAFYSRKEIKDIISYLRMISYGDDMSFKRSISTPKRGVGKKRMDFLSDYAKEHDCSLYTALKENIDNDVFRRTKVSEYVAFIDMLKDNYSDMSLVDIVNMILMGTGYEEVRSSGDEDRLENIAELKQSIDTFESSAGEEVKLEEFLDHVALYTNNDMTEKKDSVKLMTVHIAKGMEFPFVFVYELSEGVFPSVKISSTSQMEEERRLAYVAFTRAEKQLFLSDSEGMLYTGAIRFPSRFIFNCERVCMDYVVELPDDLVEDALQAIASTDRRLEILENLFEVGDRVKHKVLGPGEILSVTEAPNEGYLIQFDNLETPRMMSIKAPLEKE